MIKKSSLLVAVFGAMILTGASCGGPKGADFERVLSEKFQTDKKPEAGMRDAALEKALLPMVQKAFDTELNDAGLFQVSEVYAWDTEYEVVQSHAKAMTADHKLVDTGRSFIGGRQARFWALGKSRSGICAAISVLDYQDRKDGAWQEHQISVYYNSAESGPKPRTWTRLPCPK